MKRNGKGELMHKGTLAEGTISPFVVTAKIGEYTLVEETHSRNSAKDKETNCAMALCRLAYQISNKSK